VSLNNFTSETECDVWEVDYYDRDWQGRRMAKSNLGVRVNGGVWIEVRELLNFIAERQKELG
jgi:hypothetical protein